MPVARVAYRHDYVGLDDGRHGHGFDALLITQILTDITPYNELVNGIDELFEDRSVESEETELGTPANPVESYSKSDFLDEVYIPEPKYDRIIGTLRRKKNIILQGPKTTRQSREKQAQQAGLKSLVAAPAPEVCGGFSHPVTR